MHTDIKKNKKKQQNKQNYFLGNRVSFSSRPTTCDTVNLRCSHMRFRSWLHHTCRLMFLNEHQHGVYTVHVGIHRSIKKLHSMSSAKVRSLETTHTHEIHLNGHFMLDETFSADGRKRSARPRKRPPPPPPPPSAGTFPDAALPSDSTDAHAKLWPNSTQRWQEKGGRKDEIWIFLFLF